MLLALTGYETGLLVVAAVFIVFALVARSSSRGRARGSPGNRLGIFLAICGVFFVAQMTAVLVLAEVGEADEPVHEEPAAGEEPTEPEPTAPPPATETTATETEPSRGCGRPAAGKEVFLGSAGCTGCHTLADAGSTGVIGPNLDAASLPTTRSSSSA